MPAGWAEPAIQCRDLTEGERRFLTSDGKAGPSVVIFYSQAWLLDHLHVKGRKARTLPLQVNSPKCRWAELDPAHREGVFKCIPVAKECIFTPPSRCELLPQPRTVFLIMAACHRIVAQGQEVTNCQN
jgi:hypothetical protein